MKNQHLPFEYLEQIREWVDANHPLSGNEAIEKKYREARRTIAMLTNMSMPVPNELEARAGELADMLGVPDEETEIMNQLANELIALAKHIKSQYKNHGPRTKAPPKTLSVTLPNGRTIREAKATDTFIHTLRCMGLEKCAAIESIIQLGHPVVSREPNRYENRQPGAPKEVDGFFIETKTSTERKAEQLIQYATALGYDIDVKVE